MQFYYGFLTFYYCTDPSGSIQPEGCLVCLYAAIDDLIRGGVCDKLHSLLLSTSVYSDESCDLCVLSSLNGTS